MSVEGIQSTQRTLFAIGSTQQQKRASQMVKNMGDSIQSPAKQIPVETFNSSGKASSSMPGVILQSRV